MRSSFYSEKHSFSISIFLILMISPLIVYSQSTVLNGDFEQFSGCPNWYGQIDSALHWVNVSPTHGSPDYVNSCDTTNVVGVPLSVYGYQQAHSGEGYAGLVLLQYAFPNYREYMVGELSSTLTANQQYNFEMYVCLSEGSKYTCDDFGVYFSNTLITGVPNSLPLPYIPQIVNPTGNYPDTTNWIQITGTYTAVGNENYLMIGNFKNDNNSTVIQIQNLPTTAAYIFIDDVSLRSSVGINDINAENDLLVFPNPFNKVLNIKSESQKIREILITDLLSNLILQMQFVGDIEISTDYLDNGYYFYEILENNQVILRGKAVKY